MKLIQSRDEFKQLINTEERIICAKFTASWCGSCQQIQPLLNKLELEYNNILFVKIDIEKNEELAEKYKISSLPSFVFFKNAKNIKKVIGAHKLVLINAVKNI
jgi:thioredoxin 1